MIKVHKPTIVTYRCCTTYIHLLVLKTTVHSHTTKSSEQHLNNRYTVDRNCYVSNRPFLFSYKELPKNIL